MTDKVVPTVHADDHQSRYTYANFGKLRVYGRKVDIPAVLSAAPAKAGAYLNCPAGVFNGQVFDDKPYDMPTAHWRSADNKTVVMWPHPTLGYFTEGPDNRWVRVTGKKIKTTAKVLAAALWVNPVDNKRHLKMLLYTDFSIIYRRQNLVDAADYIEQVLTVSGFIGSVRPYNVEFNLSATEAVCLGSYAQGGSVYDIGQVLLVSCAGLVVSAALFDPTPHMGFGGGSSSKTYSSSVTDVGEIESHSLQNWAISGSSSTSVLYRIGYTGDLLSLLYTHHEDSGSSSQDVDVHIYRDYTDTTFPVTSRGVGLDNVIRRWARSSSSSATDEWRLTVIGGLSTTLYSLLSSNSSTQVQRHDKEEVFTDHTVYKVEPPYEVDSVHTHHTFKTWVAEVSSSGSSSSANTSYHLMAADFQNQLFVFLKRTATPGAGAASHYAGGYPTPGYWMDVAPVPPRYVEVYPEASPPTNPVPVYQYWLNWSTPGYSQVSGNAPNRVEVYFKGLVSYLTDLSGFGPYTRAVGPIVNSPTYMVYPFVREGPVDPFFTNSSSTTPAGSGTLVVGNLDGVFESTIELTPIDWVVTVPPNDYFLSFKGPAGYQSTGPAGYVFKGFHLTYR